MIIKEITCKSALTGKDGEFTLNPYVGCSHACAYCYAVYIARWKNETLGWGSWIYVKTNIPEVLEKQLQKLKTANVFMSTVCDVYQPIEAKYKITRRCLEVLSSAAQKNNAINITLLTKSDLILRDIDILQAFPKGTFSAGFSINTMHDDIATFFEKNASPPTQRFIAIKKLKKYGISTGIFVSPILPYITEKDLPELLKFTNENNLDFVGFDKLNYISREAGSKTRMLYKRLNKEAQGRFRCAATDSTYIFEIRSAIRDFTKSCKSKVDIHF
jgi:DNA repair photolyase